MMMMMMMLTLMMIMVMMLMMMMILVMTTIRSPYSGAGNYHVLVTRRFHQLVIFSIPQTSQQNLQT